MSLGNLGLLPVHWFRMMNTLWVLGQSTLRIGIDLKQSRMPTKQFFYGASVFPRGLVQSLVKKRFECSVSGRRCRRENTGYRKRFHWKHLCQMRFQGFDGAKKISSFQVNLMRSSVNDSH